MLAFPAKVRSRFTDDAETLAIKKMAISSFLPYEVSNCIRLIESSYGEPILAFKFVSEIAWWSDGNARGFGAI